MKQLFFLLTFCCSLFVFTACESLSDDIELSDPNLLEIPANAAEFIQANFPDYTLRGFDTEDLCDNTIVVEVELENGPDSDIDLYFTTDGEYLFSSTEITVNDLPEAVQLTIDTAYANYQIDPMNVERFDFPDGTVQYEVELIDSTGRDYDLVLAADGTVICWEADFPDDDDDDNDNDNDNDNDDNSDDDDDNDNDVSAPDSVLNQVATDYPGYQIRSTELEDLCDNEVFYTIELENGNAPDIDLYFDLNWSFVLSTTEVQYSTMPEAIITAVTINHPGYSIDTSDVERLDYPDGTINYLLDLQLTNGNDLEAIYGIDGTLICSSNSNDDDDDDDDNDDNDNDDNDISIPTTVNTFITEQYPSYRIDGVERDDLCSNEQFYEVELEDGSGPDIDLYFNLDWSLYLTATEILTSEVPQAVITALNADFPGSIIEEAELLTYADGAIGYYLEIEVETGHEWEVTYSADGILTCSDD